MARYSAINVFPDWGPPIICRCCPGSVNGLYQMGSLKAGPADPRSIPLLSPAVLDSITPNVISVCSFTNPFTVPVLYLEQGNVSSSAGSWRNGSASTSMSGRCVAKI